MTENRLLYINQEAGGNKDNINIQFENSLVVKYNCKKH